MTEEEHIARAMLMGLKYNPKIGVYFKGNRNAGEQIDAKTLKPLTFDQCIYRLKVTPRKKK